MHKPPFCTLSRKLNLNHKIKIKEKRQHRAIYFYPGEKITCLFLKNYFSNNIALFSELKRIKGKSLVKLGK